MIKIHNLTKKYDDCTAIDNLSLCISQGSICGLIGPNGSGKSTLLRTIAGIYFPEGGYVKIDGENPFENPEIKNLISFVPDNIYFPNLATINSLARMYNKIYSNFDIDYFKELTQKFPLNLNQNIAKFSKGMKRQVAILLALASKPKYLLIDENFDGLDPVAYNYIKEILISEISKNSITVVISSHNLQQLENICDSIAFIHNGKLVMHKDVFNNNVHKVQAVFKEKIDNSILETVNAKNISTTGRVTKMIVSGEIDNILKKINTLNPEFIETIPITLEEQFIYEMEELGYEH